MRRDEHERFSLLAYAWQKAARAAGDQLFRAIGGLMATAFVPQPGSRTGPCRAPCKHVDCAEQRHDAEAACFECDKPIGYGVAFYIYQGAPIHAACRDVVAGRVRRGKTGG